MATEPLTLDIAALLEQEDWLASLDALIDERKPKQVRIPEGLDTDEAHFVRERMLYLLTTMSGVYGFTITSHRYWYERARRQIGEQVKGDEHAYHIDPPTNPTFWRDYLRRHTHDDR